MRKQYIGCAESGLESTADTEWTIGISAKKEHRFGKPHAGIVRYAEEEAPSLIVMGTFRRTTTRSLLLGRVAEKLSDTHAVRC